jgi:hypothetical protein
VLCPHPAAERADDLGPLLPGLHRARAAAAQPGRDPGRRPPDRRAEGGRNTNLQASALKHGRAAPGPGRGPPLLDILPLHPAGVARVHRDVPGPPARPRGLLGGRAPAGRRRPREPPQPGGAGQPGHPSEQGDQGSGPPGQRRARRSGSPQACWRPRAGHPVMRPADYWRQPSAERPDNGGSWPPWSSWSVASAGVLRCGRALRPSVWLVVACGYDVVVHPAQPSLADKVVDERVCPVPVPGEPAPQLRLGCDD